MHTSFANWVKENNPGNYVSVDVTGLPIQLVSYLPGIVNSKPHITLMYSKNSHVPLEHIDYVLRRYKIIGSTVFVDDAAIFDSQDDSSKGCIVLKVVSPVLTDIHNHLSRIGLKHSYQEFSPHATLIYDVPLDQAKIELQHIKNYINDNGVTLQLTKFNNEYIKENWASELSK